MIYTGPVDTFFDYCYGKLPYRSLEFKHETHDTSLFQQAPVVNYPNDQLYTRVTEFKYLTGQEHSKTSIVYEFPKAEGDAYYPVPRKENADLYVKYKALADATPNVHFVGRLATYKYYNMDQIVAQALTTYAKIAGMKRLEAVANFSGHQNGNGNGDGHHANGNGSKVADFTERKTATALTLTTT
jgi:UDP-galactopyranose mutase